ncbi:MAG: DNA (cytosine-5-)-methyltransferase [Corynebacterium sp.]|uniref:DNA cytosine methyltransferase n=1 Tax=Corynebacterium sp. TaxID=1720 RepID=UPI0026DF5A84|nr:DNA (cytosine-5-)-methyltransferase [Corynebacterium sp.]MDO5670115.1 DNA (cytosine-5-)-methyltransferase [Corynebacterium sp.]
MTVVPPPTQSFRFVDLFSGLGGFHVALRDLGGEAVFAAEWEPTLNALYKDNYGIEPWSDLNELETDDDIAREVPDHEVLTAGFPCQPFSKAGDQLGFKDTSQGNLFFKVHQILKVKRPQRFILENVPNILRHDGGNTKETILTELSALGYTVRVAHFSPHEFGIPQVRDRAYFVGSLDGLDGFEWPAKHKEQTDITSVLRDHVPGGRTIPELTLRAIDMWGDFLKRSPKELKLPSFPIWAMEFGATYPYEHQTPPGIWERRRSRGFNGLHMKGSFGFELDGLTITQQQELIPSHSRRQGDLSFPRWKQTFIRQNREFFHDNASWITPWMNQWQPWDFPSSFQKLEWNAQGEERDIDRFVLQVRASGLRIKRPTTAPSLIAFTQTQVPILGARLAGERRYMTPSECAQLQSLGDIDLPAHDLDAYKALGNAVNAKVVGAIAASLLDTLLPSVPNAHSTTLNRPVGAVA